MFIVPAGLIEIIFYVLADHVCPNLFHGSKIRKFREHGSENKRNQSPFPHVVIIGAVGILIKPPVLDADEPDPLDDFESQIGIQFIGNAGVEHSGV